MQDIIDQLEACQEEFREFAGYIEEWKLASDRYASLLGAHRALIDRLKEKTPKWTYNVFDGEPPERYSSWMDFATSMDYEGVYVRAVRKGDWVKSGLTLTPEEMADGMAGKEEV